ncbi:MAG: four helix bundle protein [Victivallales bacterium]
MAQRIESYKDLRVYQNSVEVAMEIFELTKKFPHEEKYSMVDQMRRASRSVCTNIAEAWRKRRYKAAFIAKLSDSESEACEMQVWNEFALRCSYMNLEAKNKVEQRYEHIMSQLVLMIDEADKWLIK